MFLASLTISGTNWLPPLAGGLLVLLAVLVWSYRAAPAGWMRWACLTLKLLGMTALAFCLLEPLWTGQRAKPGANLFAVVADNSQGMLIHDAGDLRSRAEGLRELLDPGRARWLAPLESEFELRRYLFDARLQNTRDFSELNFDGRSSAIGAALRTLAERYQGRPLAGVLLFTDGNATDIHGALPDLTGLPPVYPVVIGRPDAVKDISLQQVAVSQTIFEDAPVAVQAEVSTAGFRGEKVMAQVRDRMGKVVAEQTVRGRDNGATAGLRFQLKPEKPGVSFYQMRVGTEGEIGRGANATNSVEATLANNSRVLVVDRGQGPFRILYVAGRPNWEFKFLNRAVADDDQLQLVGLIRIAKREPKFEFRGRAGETGNPLFRGFGDQTREATERYDQPVLTRLNTRDEVELRSGFPRTAEELYSYHAVIVDDLEAEFFAPEQAQLLQKFVSERGGGFLMLGGMESFQQGQYQRTPIGDMLPVYLDRADESQPPGPLTFGLAREGWLQSWARVRDNEGDERSRLGDMPKFEVLNRVREVKPGASVIATVTDEAGKEYPALAVQRFGRGRTAALMVGDVWRWGMKDAAAHADMDKSWRQLLRSLIADVPNRVELAAEPQPEDPNGAMQLKVRVRDAKFQPLDNAAVSIVVEPVLFDTAPGVAVGSSLRLQAEPSLTEPGLYEATYVPRLTGGFKATASVTNSVGVDVGRAEAGWSTDLAAEEFRSLTPNTALLENIAQKTGGEVISAAQLEAFVRRLPTRRAPVMEAWSYPLWHTPAMFAVALTCLLAEWGLRRWKGLP
jgi:uncharacterized membrane protein